MKVPVYDGEGHILELDFEGNHLVAIMGGKTLKFNPSWFFRVLKAKDHSLEALRAWHDCVEEVEG